jgi:hypothetical protein
LRIEHPGLAAHGAESVEHESHALGFGEGSTDPATRLLEDVAFGGRELVMVVVYVLRHVDFQRGPVVAVGLEEIVPGPGVLGGHQIVHALFAADQAFVVRRHGVYVMGC